MYRGVPEQFQDLVKKLCEELAPGAHFAVLRPLSGKSGATVLLVDISRTRAAHFGAKGGRLHGEYVLKLSEARGWDEETELSEQERYASARNSAPDFFERHVPSLVAFKHDGRRSAILYEVAGGSAAGLTAADGLGNDMPVLISSGRVLVRSLLTDLNRMYKVDQSLSAGDLLREWLGYRLDPDKAPALHQFVGSRSVEERIVIAGPRALTNPLWLCQQRFIEGDRPRARFAGLIHGDLHLGNVLVSRSPASEEKYWLIDFALSRNGPLFYDHAYFELSWLLHGLAGVGPEQLIGVLAELDATTLKPVPSIPFELVGLFQYLNALRMSVREWQEECEPGHHDAILAQQLLARVAVSLCWANKPLSEAERSLALYYGSWAAHVYLQRFHPAELTVTPGMPRESTTHVGVPTAFVKAEDTEWDVLWRQLARFDGRTGAYILIAGRQDYSPDLAAMGMLPWSVVIDLDPQSDVDGLFASAAPVIEKRRSLSQHHADAPTAPDFARGTTWVMAGGWETRHVEPPSSEVAWRRQYVRAVRELCVRMRRAVSSQTVHVLVLPGQGLTEQRLRPLAEAIDEEFEDRTSIILIGRETLDTTSVAGKHVPLDRQEFLASVRRTYGVVSDTGLPEVPGKEGPVPIPVEMLRQLEADMEVLHSRIIADAVVGGAEHDAFWQGNAPTWADLHAQVDVPRAVSRALRRQLEEWLDSRRHTVYLPHTPGAGGTTASRRAAWDLSQSYPTVVLRCLSQYTVDRLARLYQRTQKPILLVAEASILPRAAREQLFEELAQRHVRFVMLYVERTVQPTGQEIEVTGPMGREEAEAFKALYSGHTSDSRRRQELAKITSNARYERHRIPFFYGLIAYERDFRGIDRYVGAHIGGLRYATCKPLAYLALVTRYAQQLGLDENVLKRLLAVPPEAALDLDAAMGPAAGLVVRSDGQCRLMHPLLAEEALCQLFGAEPDGRRNYLKSLSLDFIRDIVQVSGADSVEVSRLFISLFIERGRWVVSGDPEAADEQAAGRRLFSELIHDIPNMHDQYEVLEELTKRCPAEAHYWNHLGRHRIHALKESFATAETHLRKAVELDDQEELQHHSLGMVYRCWVRDELDRLFASRIPPTPEQVLEKSEHLAALGAQAFARARILGPESEYGYVSHMQMILEIAERIQRAASAAPDTPGRNRTVGPLAAQGSGVGKWLADNMAIVEDLIAQVQYQRSGRDPSPPESRCRQSLARLYGEYQSVIQLWERLLRAGADRPDLRRLLAGAYHASRGRAWHAVPISELRRIVELMEANLQYGPLSDLDLRYWFQAYRRVPEFSYQRALAQLEAWVPRTSSPDAHYYLYILHFLRWLQKESVNTERIRYHLEHCKTLSMGRRSHSYEWLALGPEWCPLAHESELGGWDEPTEFWRQSGRLRRVEGVIGRFRGGQSGDIQLGPGITAFYVPSRAGIWESADTNAVVTFYLGFSYDGFRAWSPEKVPPGANSSGRP